MSPTSAIDPALPVSASIRTHSAPARVLPKPRPAIISQTRQLPAGGSCDGRAQSGQAWASRVASAGVSPASNASIAARSAVFSQRRHTAAKSGQELLVILGLVGSGSARAALDGVGLGPLAIDRRPARPQQEHQQRI